MESSLDRFGNLLAGFVRETQAAGSSPPLELGTLNADGSLSVDSLSRSIPKGEYMVGLHLQSVVGGALQTHTATHTHDGGTHTHSGGEHAQETGSGAHSHNGGAHTHSGGAHTHGIPQTMRGLQAGDRVLVAWVGAEPIIVDIVVSS